MAIRQFRRKETSFDQFLNHIERDLRTTLSMVDLTDAMGMKSAFLAFTILRRKETSFDQFLNHIERDLRTISSMVDLTDAMGMK